MTPTRETIQQSLVVLNTLEGLAERFSLSTLGMTDADFERAKKETEHAPGTVEYLETFGVAADLRRRWRAP